MSLSHSVLSQSRPPKSVGSGGVGVGGSYTTLQPGVKLDEKSIENGLEGQKLLVVCLFWGGCHHPNHYYHWVKLTFVQTTGHVQARNCRFTELAVMVNRMLLCTHLSNEEDCAHRDAGLFKKPRVNLVTKARGLS